MIESGRVRLPVADVERALRFYIERLGVKLIASPAGTTRLDLGGGFEIELVQGTGSTALALQLRGDFDEAIGTYENRSLVLQRGEGPNGPYAECTDLDGNVLRFEGSSSV